MWAAHCRPWREVAAGDLGKNPRFQDPLRPTRERPLPALWLQLIQCPETGTGRGGVAAPGDTPRCGSGARPGLLTWAIQSPRFYPVLTSPPPSRPHSVSSQCSGGAALRGVPSLARRWETDPLTWLLASPKWCKVSLSEKQSFQQLRWLNGPSFITGRTSPSSRHLRGN